MTTTTAKIDRLTKKWVRSSADELAVDDGCRFDLKAAERVRDFFKRFLRHSKGRWAGQPFELLEYQWSDIIAPLFGWQRADGTRRFRKGGVWIAKKNGKSLLGSALSLYMLIADGERGAEVYNAASDRDQAGIVFNEALNMVNASPALSSRLRPVPSVKRIVFEERASWYKALSADVPTKEGLNWHFLLFDELHAQTKRDLWETLVYGGAARRQPLLLSISTAGYDRTSIGYEQYQYAKNVRGGVIVDTAFFPYIAEAEQEDDWLDPKVWRKANPSLDVTVKEEDMAEACREAQAAPAKENAFRRYRLNQWTTNETRWLNMEFWDACGAPFDPAILDGLECFGGLDLASTQDTCSLVLEFTVGDLVYVLPFFWVPEEACKERERRNKTRLDEWVRRGFIRATPGNVTDYDRIREDIRELSQKYFIRDIGVDRWNSSQLVTQLKGDGLSMFLFGQGYASMSVPAKEFEKLMLGGKLRHGGHPVLRWMASNVSAETDAAENVKPSKRASHEKIDGIVAACMARGRSMAVLTGLYDTQGITIL
jgi:phage terminase large subunit-like protein